MKKVALITGASRGIGRACAVALAKRGYDIAVNYNSNDAKAKEVVDEITSLGRKAVAYKADTADLNAVKQMFRDVVKEFGKLDVLVNNAGVVDDAYLLMIREDSLTRSLDINIKGYFHCAQQAALKMLSKRSGKIINISSVSSVLAVEGQAVYSATKGAVNSMTAVMAKELAPKGITVNAVAMLFPRSLRQSILNRCRCTASQTLRRSPIQWRRSAPAISLTLRVRLSCLTEGSAYDEPP